MTSKERRDELMNLTIVQPLLFERALEIVADLEAAESALAAMTKERDVAQVDAEQVVERAESAKRNLYALRLAVAVLADEMARTGYTGGGHMARLRSIVSMDMEAIRKVIADTIDDNAGDGWNCDPYNLADKILAAIGGA